MKYIMSVIAILIFLITIFFVSDATGAEWNKLQTDSDVAWRYDCGSLGDHSGTTIILHGGINHSQDALKVKTRKIDENRTYDPLFDSCQMVVVIAAIRFDIDGEPSQMWDFTDKYTSGRGTQRLIDYIIMTKQFFPESPINILGGSAGGVMAYKLALELQLMGKSYMISKLALTDTVSPYNIAKDRSPRRFQGFSTQAGFSFSGFTFYEAPNAEYIELGLPSTHFEWLINTLIVNSVNDTVTPDYYKAKLADGIQSRSDTVRIVESGSNHNVGDNGLKIIVDFFT